MRLVGSTFLLLLFNGVFFGLDARPALSFDDGNSSFELVAQDRNSITGFVFGADRTPLSRINVELQTEFYTSVSRTMTNGAGVYTFHGLPPGRYIVKVLTVGTDYQDQVQGVSLVPISAVQGRGAVSEQLDFYLKVKERRGENLSPPTVVVAQDVPDQAKKLYEEGIKLLDEDKEQEGWEKLKGALEIFPDYFYALEKLGNEYVAKGYWEAAAILLRKANAVYGKSFSSAFGLGLAEFRLGRNQVALEQFRIAADLEKSSINAHMWLGISFHANSKFEDALSSLLTANKLSGGTASEVYWQLARVYKDMNRFAEAADSLELYLKYRPTAENAEEVKRIIALLKAKK